MKLELKSGIILEADTTGEYKVLNGNFDKLPDGFYFTKNNKKVWIEEGKIINILELISWIVRLLIKIFMK